MEIADYYLANMCRALSSVPHRVKGVLESIAYTGCHSESTRFDNLVTTPTYTPGSLEKLLALGYSLQEIRWYLSAKMTGRGALHLHEALAVASREQEASTWMGMVETELAPKDGSTIPWNARNGSELLGAGRNWDDSTSYLYSKPFPSVADLCIGLQHMGYFTPEALGKEIDRSGYPWPAIIILRCAERVGSQEHIKLALRLVQKELYREAQRARPNFYNIQVWLSKLSIPSRARYFAQVSGVRQFSALLAPGATVAQIRKGLVIATSREADLLGLVQIEIPYEALVQIPPRKCLAVLHTFPWRAVSEAATSHRDELLNHMLPLLSSDPDSVPLIETALAPHWKRPEYVATPKSSTASPPLDLAGWDAAKHYREEVAQLVPNEDRRFVFYTAAVSMSGLSSHLGLYKHLSKPEQDLVLLLPPNMHAAMISSRD